MKTELFSETSVNFYHTIWRYVQKKLKSFERKVIQVVQVETSYMGG